MKTNVTNQVVQCQVCRQYFTLGVDGDGDVCDVCADIAEGLDDATEIYNDEDAP